MNYTLERINNHEMLEWFERDVEHTNYTRYNLFVKHASHEYDAMSSEQRNFYIQSIPGLAEGDNNVYDFNYNKLIVVNDFYRYQMNNEIKQAWFNRANFLNHHHQNGQFLILPIRVQEESFLRSILRRECPCFQQMMIRALVQKKHAFCINAVL